MAREIRLSDGTTYGAVWCGAADGVLSMNLAEEMTVLEAAEVFSDAERTEKIVFRYGGDEITEDAFEGYTRLRMVQGPRARGQGMLIQMIRGGE